LAHLDNIIAPPSALFYSAPVGENQARSAYFVEIDRILSGYNRFIKEAT
jgi:hypothetical protein